MGGEREKKEKELTRNRFDNVEQRRTLQAINTEIQRARQKVKTIYLE